MCRIKLRHLLHALHVQGVAMANPRSFKYFRLLPLALLCTAAPAQMHKVERPDSVTRAVSVYEYVGDYKHPKAARLIPVSLFIGGQFEDAGVYLARPIPLALDTGNRYVLERSGVHVGFLDVKLSRDTERTAGGLRPDYDEGWFGYGTFAPLAVAHAGKLRPNCGNAHVVTDSPTPTPKLHGASDNSKLAQPQKAVPCEDTADDDHPAKIDLPDETRRADSPDPERPTLHRSPESSAHNTGAKSEKKQKIPAAVVTAPAGGPDSDPDRPMIHRRTATDDADTIPPDPADLHDEAPKAAPSSAGTSHPTPLAQQSETHSAEVTITGAASPESDRPVLQRGGQPPAPAFGSAPGSPSSPQSSTAVQQPMLPEMVAVSDPVIRPQHNFSHAFASPAERTSVLSQVQELARQVIANPMLATDLTDAERLALAKHQRGPAPSTSPAHTSTARSTHARTRTSLSHRLAAKKTEEAPSQPFADEFLAGYELSFDAPVTYVYTATLPGQNGAPDRYVAVIAQADPDGKLQPAFRSTTDAAHLDRKQRYRFVDVVDPDASNRADLLFEQRSAGARQFGLYRLLGSRPDQVFLTGTMHL